MVCEMLERYCPRAARVLEEAEPDALAYLDFPSSHWKRLLTDNVQERVNREIKRRSRMAQIFPSESSLFRLVGTVMCDQTESWSGSRHFSERGMAEMHDAALRKGASGCHGWAELVKTARKMVESSLELADRMESA
jgi:transposase-like protein